MILLKIGKINSWIIYKYWRTSNLSDLEIICKKFEEKNKNISTRLILPQQNQVIHWKYFEYYSGYFPLTTSWSSLMSNNSIKPHSLWNHPVIYALLSLFLDSSSALGIAFWHKANGCNFYALFCLFLTIRLTSRILISFYAFW